MRYLTVTTLKSFFIVFLTYGDGGQIILFETRKLFAKYPQP